MPAIGITDGARVPAAAERRCHAVDRHRSERTFSRMTTPPTRLPWASRRRAARGRRCDRASSEQFARSAEDHRLPSLSPSGFDTPSLANAKCACHLRRSNRVRQGNIMQPAKVNAIGNVEALPNIGEPFSMVQSFARSIGDEWVPAAAARTPCPGTRHHAPAPRRRPRQNAAAMPMLRSAHRQTITTQKFVTQ